MHTLRRCLNLKILFFLMYETWYHIILQAKWEIVVKI
jgi:hypothetical protein